MTTTSSSNRPAGQPNSGDSARATSAPAQRNPLLEAAWKRQNAYSDNASRYQTRFVALRTTLAVLSVVVVILSVLENPGWQCPTTTPLTDPNLACMGHWFVDNALLILPITISALLAFSIRFDRGQNWILLRGNAETLKMEIYYYRTRTKPYDKNRDEQLAKRIKQISEGMKGSPVHQGALSPYEEESDTELHTGIFIKLFLLIFRAITASVNLIWKLLFQVERGKKKKNKFKDRFKFPTRATPNKPSQVDLSSSQTGTHPETLASSQALSNSSDSRQNFDSEDTNHWDGVNQQMEPSLNIKLNENEQDSKQHEGRKYDLYQDLTGDPETYLEERLMDQFNWYRRKAETLAHQLQKFQAGVYLFGGIGTLLATTDNYKGWVAVTTAFTGAFVNFLEFKRVEASLVGYNQAADTLYDIRAWWYSLTPQDREKPENFGKLVESCEGTIRSENVSWLQDMQERLTKLYETTGTDEPDDTNGKKQKDGKPPAPEGPSSLGDTSDQPMDKQQQTDKVIPSPAQKL
jgi:hypothetical protein